MSDKVLSCGATLKGNCSAVNGVSKIRWYHSILCTLQSAVDYLTTLVLGRAASGTVVDSTGTALTVKYARAQIAANQTEATLIAAVTGKQIRVLGLTISTAGTATVSTILSNGTSILGSFNKSANSNLVLPVTEHGWAQTAAGEALKVTTSNGSATDYTIVYVEV